MPAAAVNMGGLGGSLFASSILEHSLFLGFGMMPQGYGQV